MVVGQHDRVIFHKAYGKRALMPDPLPMTEDTVFDLASLTKPVATATAVMILVERGKLGLDEHIDRYVPECEALAKRGDSASPAHARVGPSAETPFGDYEHGRAEAIRRICAISLILSPVKSSSIPTLHSFC